MRIENREGEPLTEATISVADDELIDLLQGLADVVEGKRDHLHFQQLGGPQLVVRRSVEGQDDPLARQIDWWVGPVVLFGAVFLIVGVITVFGWALRLL